MRLITQITWSHIRQNRRTSLAVMVAVLLSATLLCSFCIFGAAFWGMSTEATRHGQGDWHGELFDDTPGAQLPYLEGNPKVEAVMVKGAWQVVQLPENTALPYLFLRDANTAYWQDMPERHAIMEGRIPQQAGEIAVSKLFFERNPQYEIGDTILLPVGERILGDEILPAQSIRQEGESFHQADIVTFTIVGSLDLTTTTAYPGYYALGYLNPETVGANDGLTIYLRFVNMGKTYTLLPEIAEAVGLRQDEFGEYRLRYNEPLLRQYGITDGSGLGGISVMSIMVGLVVVMMIATFALIIGSVFSLSANARLRQMGVLRSVGASPGQIKASILLEGMMLSVIPLAMAVVLGYLFSSMMGNLFTFTLGELLEYPLVIRFSPTVALCGVLVSLATVLLAAYSTARKLARLTPIQAVRGIGEANVKRRREKHHPLITRLFGYPGALAMNTLATYRKSYRLPVAALCLSFILVGSTLCMIGLAKTGNELEYAKDYYDVQVMLFLTQERDDALIKELRTSPGMTESAVISSVDFGFTAEESRQTTAFLAEGGFAGMNSSRYNITRQGENWRIHGTLLGLDDESFARYCASLGVDTASYLTADSPKAIAVSALNPNPDARTREEREHIIPWMNFTPGESLILEERTFADTKTNHTFSVEVGAVTQSMPVIDRMLSHYRMVLVLPMAQYDAIVADFLPERANLYRRTDVKLITTIEGLTAEAELDKICAAYLGSEDYRIASREGQMLRQATMNKSVLVMNNGIAALFALIGISNAFSSVAGNLSMRRRELAMLRSVGLDAGGLSRMLLIEGIFFAVRPILLALPWIGAICVWFIWMLDLPFGAVLSSLPGWEITGYGLAVLLVMGLAYFNGARQIRRANLAETLRSDIA